ncbi:hypothetical protein ANCCAN_18190 [Ancylostoma caninum]|uniref:Uncharacterized protein n=1 Tax=Ancylostoma caninum TaxID=29170 RepID=A0A368G034_ANCCA|nr:hypothetical protein ANCCAN_18190 [Ancylostoma caninum]
MKIVKAGIDLHLLNRKRPIRFVSCSNESMFMTKFVLTRTPTPPTPLLSQREGGIQRPVSPRLGQSDDVVPDLPGLHHQILDGSLRCKRACVEGTDRHHSPSGFRQPR